jgi:hypothetical protein
VPAETAQCLRVSCFADCASEASRANAGLIRRTLGLARS